MATYTSNYGWTKPSGSDNVDISVLNDNLDDQDSTIHDAFLNMAPPFSESSTYAVDDIVLYGTTTYKCHTAVVTPGSWTGSTNWQVYKLSEGGGGGLTLGETSSTAYRGDRGKTAYDHSQTTGNPHGTTASDVGLGNVPNVSTNDQTPTFTAASTRNNIASGEKLSVIFGKIQKFFNDLKSVAYSGSYNDLTNKPTIPDELADLTADSTHRVVTDAQISTWNGKSDFSGSYTDLTDKPKINSVELSGNKTTSDIGINATNVMLSDGVTSVKDALDNIRCGVFNNAPSVPAATNAEFTIPFGYTFSAPPVVTANLYGTLNLTDMIGVNIRTVSTTGFVVRVRNVNTVALAPKISWIAILK